MAQVQLSLCGSILCQVHRDPGPTRINPSGSLPSIARNAFFDEKCSKLQGRCVNSCQKNEELVALCQKSLKCCLTLQPCWKNTNDESEGSGIPE
ncbi:LOW QUALITY PROTEIN: beta-defensin 106A-like [Felis catus]|uniref:LOW QUALITY PROTEIN: beta-defensin 106A-like n=1 Tax=Felis catus TaxID=9685 RepID=UPI001D1A22F5|nr:LOW QUALITY PROTEIN: beta-defensin 106A-like [Felis catus]